MKKLLGVLVLAAFAGSAYAAVGTDMATDCTSHWTGPTDDPVQVGYFPCPDTYTVGLGFDGTYVWVSAGDQGGAPCKFYLFDEYGNQIDVGGQGGGATGWGHRDLAFSNGVMFGSFSNLVGGHSYGGSSIFIYEGYFVGGPINPNRAMAYNGGSNYFYTGGFGTNLYQLAWNGVWGSSAVVTDLGGPYSGTYGLAYDCWQDCLWCTTASSTGEIYQFDTTGFPLNVYVDPAHPTYGGCEMANTTQYGYVLAALAQESPDGVVFYNVGSQPSPVQPASWGQIKSLF